MPLEYRLEGLGGFGEALGPLWGRFGGPWVPVEGLWKNWGALTGTPQRTLAYSCSFKGGGGTLRATLEHPWGPLRRPVDVLGGSLGPCALGWPLGCPMEGLGGFLEALGESVVDPWGPLKALGSTYMEPKVHFGIQLERNKLFLGSEGGSRRVQNLIVANSWSEINDFEGCDRAGASLKSHRHEAPTAL